MSCLRVTSLIAFGLPIWAQAMPPVMSVCELLTNREKYHGKLVEVRGLVKGGGHGAWLAAEDCGLVLKAAGYKWPNQVHLTFPHNQSPIKDDHANFEVNFAAIRKLDQAARKAKYDPETDLQRATYTGLFRALGDLSQHLRGDSRNPTGAGFGPESAPAQLLIQSARDLTIVKNGGAKAR
jgi:hypothetical protein